MKQVQMNSLSIKEKENALTEVFFYIYICLIFLIDGIYLFMKFKLIFFFFITQFIGQNSSFITK